MFLLLTAPSRAVKKAKPPPAMDPLLIVDAPATAGKPAPPVLVVNFIPIWVSQAGIWLATLAHAWQVSHGVAPHEVWYR